MIKVFRSSSDDRQSISGKSFPVSDLHRSDDHLRLPTGLGGKHDRQEDYDHRIKEDQQERFILLEHKIVATSENGNQMASHHDRADYQAQGPDRDQRLRSDGGI